MKTSRKKSNPVDSRKRIGYIKAMQVWVRDKNHQNFRLWGLASFQYELQGPEVRNPFFVLYFDRNGVLTETGGFFPECLETPVKTTVPQDEILSRVYA